ncbi:MAG: class A beta-lactamase-related serine hydrolase, partial [Chloroflexota bacterium]
MPPMEALTRLLHESLGSVYTAAQVEVRWRNAIIYRAELGTLDAEGRLEGEGVQRVRRQTRFDYASLTKLFTTLAFFRLVDSGRVQLDQPVCSLLPELRGERPIQPYPNPLKPDELVEVVPPTAEKVDASKVTFYHLLTHSSGLAAWLDLRTAPDVPARRAMCLHSPFSAPLGTKVIYSDIGYILLGMALEALTDHPLREAMQRLVLRPLELSAIYSPIAPPGSVPPTEVCAWRGKRVQGEVHDENAAALGGAAGHAGLFGTASDIAAIGQLYLDEGGGFISPRLAREAVRQHIGDRGLGWQMRPTEPEATVRALSARSYGHTGFVGNSLWVDPERQLVVALLTNNVFFGRQERTIL